MYSQTCILRPLKENTKSDHISYTSGLYQTGHFTRISLKVESIWVTATDRWPIYRGGQAWLYHWYKESYMRLYWTHFFPISPKLYMSFNASGRKRKIAFFLETIIILKFEHDIMIKHILNCLERDAAAISPSFEQTMKEYLYCASRLCFRNLYLVFLIYSSIPWKMSPATHWFPQSTFVDQCVYMADVAIFSLEWWATAFKLLMKIEVYVRNV